jgi:hypothetical protein
VSTDNLVASGDEQATMELTFRQTTRQAREMMNDHRWTIMEAAHAVIDRPNSLMTHSSALYDHKAPLL